jgi:hypothetical protein
MGEGTSDIHVGSCSHTEPALPGRRHLTDTCGTFAVHVRYTHNMAFCLPCMGEATSVVAGMCLRCRVLIPCSPQHVHFHSLLLPLTCVHVAVVVLISVVPCFGNAASSCSWLAFTVFVAVCCTGTARAGHSVSCSCSAGPSGPAMLSSGSSSWGGGCMPRLAVHCCSLISLYCSPWGLAHGT